MTKFPFCRAGHHSLERFSKPQRYFQLLLYSAVIAQTPQHCYWDLKHLYLLLYNPRYLFKKQFPLSWKKTSSLVLFNISLSPQRYLGLKHSCLFHGTHGKSPMASSLLSPLQSFHLSVLTWLVSKHMKTGSTVTACVTEKQRRGKSRFPHRISILASF